MKERERIIVTGLVVLLLVLWLGFVFHRSPDFAGSLTGGILAVAGALLMTIPLAYLFVKRIPGLRSRLKPYVSMRTLLSWHIYAGILGPILVILHTGHKFESPLGIALTLMTLVVVFSGFAGRYLMSHFSSEIREKKTLLKELHAVRDRMIRHLAGHPHQAEAVRPFSGILSRMAAGLIQEPRGMAADIDAPVTPIMVVRLAESIADVEYAIETHQTFRRWFGTWLKWHIAVSALLYVLMILHVWAAVHFGLRWFKAPTTDHFRSTDPLAAAPADASFGTEPHSTAVQDFHRAFGRLFESTWRPPARINGISTTVFNYAEWARQARKEQSDFQKAVAALKRVQPGDLNGGDREKIFWINVYNFTAMKLAAENYPVDSITSRKISLTGNPWSLKTVTVGNRSYSLRQIETDMLLSRFNDPRIVFAVSCAAVSCPDRPSRLFTADAADSQLDSLVDTFFQNRSKGLRLDTNSRTLTVSWILKADRPLFGSGDDGVLQFIIRYAPPDIAAWLRRHGDDVRMTYFEHDWSLNDVALTTDEASE